MFISKEDCEKILHTKIRQDTYVILKVMNEDRLSYQEACKKINLNKKKYQIDENQILTKEPTIKKHCRCLQSWVKFQEAEDNRHQNKEYGIYGIYVDNNLVYIGLTLSGFKARYQQHKTNMKDMDNKQNLYLHLRKSQSEGKNIVLKSIISNLDLKTESQLTRRDWESIELGLITLYKPACNQEGKTITYKFSNKK